MGDGCAADAETEALGKGVEGIIIRLEAGFVELADYGEGGFLLAGRLGAEEDLRRAAGLAVDRKKLLEELAADSRGERLGVGLAASEYLRTPELGGNNI